MTTTRATKKAASPEPKKAATKKAATPTKAATRKAATPKDGLKAALVKKGWQVALTRNQAIAAYCKQRTLLHGAGPLAYRTAAAKALDISDEAFLAAFYAPKAPKPEGK